jgi:hypothetical protein
MESTQVRRKRDVLTSGPSQHLRRTIIGASSQIMQQVSSSCRTFFTIPLTSNLKLKR